MVLVTNYRSIQNNGILFREKPEKKVKVKLKKNKNKNKNKKKKNNRRARRASLQSKPQKKLYDNTKFDYGITYRKLKLDKSISYPLELVNEVKWAIDNIPPWDDFWNDILTNLVLHVEQFER